MPSLHVRLVTPAGLGTHHGNRVTAERWAELLVEAGHSVTVTEQFTDESADVLVALHARRSAESVRSFAKRCPGAPIVVALTGTDLYPDLAATGVPPDVLDLADRFVVLQPLGIDQLPLAHRDRARVIYQSSELPLLAPVPASEYFTVVVLAHLRAVKDPLLTARATRHLPSASRVRVVHYGAALEPELADAALAEERANPRYRWFGDRPPAEARGALGAAQLLALTSVDEGGANVLSEAIAAGVPVAATAIPGTIGILGRDYRGYVPRGDAGALASLLDRLERDEGGCHGELTGQIAALRPLVSRAGERRRWEQLLAELVRGERA